MPFKPATLQIPRTLLFGAASDFFFLQNRSYPRKAALDWVGNRYQLTSGERELLRRGVFSQEQALHRRSRRCLGDSWESSLLVVDGHNVHITLESALLGRPLLKGNDGALRDTAGASGNFRLTEVTMTAMGMLFNFLRVHRPSKVLFLFDAPMSGSGELAGRYRKELQSLGIPGDARAVPVPEREIPYGECTVASSDQAVLNRSSKWLDLAYRVLSVMAAPGLTVDFSFLTELRTACTAFFPDWNPFFPPTISL